jgi:hypothetical protein
MQGTSVAGLLGLFVIVSPNISNLLKSGLKTEMGKQRVDDTMAIATEIAKYLTVGGVLVAAKGRTEIGDLYSPSALPGKSKEDFEVKKENS